MEKIRSGEDLPIGAVNIVHVRTAERIPVARFFMKKKESLGQQ